MIFKWIFLIVFILLVFWLLKRLKPKQKLSYDMPAEIVEDMVRCAYCGVHHPQSESISENGQNFCCTRHQQLHLQH
ncbi:PP0621 family protein [Nitrosomonas sp.]|uniref:PP0621 family protein n=1 Tax=Nitrosomonas sp. TaxID=42353 RepID=UPI0025E35C85|nr:PP0621 family protein [Nitrosomonas sp.]MCC6916584.1 hypothetical protein [Nitrosomonas sp.]